jgi:hypothetical protein
MCGSVDERGSVGWLDVLHPDPIRRIWISFPTPKVSHLRGIATIQSLYDLSAPESDNVNRHIMSIISHPSALEELRITPFMSWSCNAVFEPPSNYPLRSLSLHSLHFYHGPHQILSWVSTGPTLTSTELTTVDKSLYLEPSTLLKTLRRENIGDSIQSLTIHVNDIPDTLLMTISARFMHLKNLKMHARRVNEDLVSPVLCTTYFKLKVFIT